MSSMRVYTEVADIFKVTVSSPKNITLKDKVPFHRIAKWRRSEKFDCSNQIIWHVEFQDVTATERAKIRKECREAVKLCIVAN